MTEFFLLLLLGLGGPLLAILQPILDMILGAFGGGAGA